MTKRTKIALLAAAAIAVVGAGGALAAAKLSPQEESKAVVEDAARQLGVEPAELTGALKRALKNRIDAAVADGRLTDEQGDALKQRVDEDDFPLLGRPFFGHRRGPHQHGPGASLDAAADHLGMTESELHAALRDGRSLAEVARARGKSIDGLVDALVRAATERLDDAVEDGELTKKQRDRLLRGLEQRVTRAVEADPPRGFGFRGLGGRGHHGPAGDA